MLGFKLNYFNGNLSQGFVALFSGRMIQFVAMGLVGLFLPIFLFEQLHGNIQIVLTYYIIGHLIYALFVPLGAQFLNKIGLRRSLRISVLFDAAFYVCMFFLAVNPSLFLILSVIAVTFGRMTFWLPYHIDFAKFTDKLNRGKEVGLMWATKSLLSIVMPIAAGLLIAMYGYSIVFILAIILFLCAGIPFLTLPRTHENFSWTYRQTVRNFFSKDNRQLVIANMANGAENDVAIVIWPIFIYQLLQGNYLAVGALSSLIVLLTVIIQLMVGKYTDVFNKRKMLHWGSIAYATGWLAKAFVLTAFQTFVAGTYHSFTQIFKDTPFDALNYEMLADRGHYVDEYTVLKEMAVQFGKVLMLTLVIVIASSFGLNWAFIFAALISLFVNFL